MVYKLAYWHLLYLSLMQTFYKIKENVVTEKTDEGFHGSDNTNGFLSYWHADVMCHTSMLYWEFPLKNAKEKEQISLQLNW